MLLLPLATDLLLLLLMTHNASNGIIINWTWNAARIAPSAR